MINILVIHFAIEKTTNPAWEVMAGKATQLDVTSSHRAIASAAIERHPEREEEFIERRNAVHREHMTAVLEGVKALAEG